MPSLQSPRVTIFACILINTVLVATGMCSRADEVTDLHAILKSDASLHDKGVACLRLAVIGNNDSIPILADLLHNSDLSQPARAALEAMPSSQVDVVFRTQLTRLESDQLIRIGIIDSIGSRRDAASVPSLAGLLPQSPSAIQLSIVTALGKIASDESSSLLLQLLRNPSKLDLHAIADATLRCADRFAQEGKTSEAIVLYNAVRSSPAASNILDAATLSLIRTSDSEGLSLLDPLLNSSDDNLFSVGLQAARLLPKSDVVGLLTSALKQATPERSVMLLDTLYDLGDRVALPAVKDAIDSENIEVQTAAIRAMGKVGDKSTLELLLQYSRDENNAIASAARSSLEGLKGDDIDQAILDAIQRDRASQEGLIRLIGVRRIQALPILWTAMKSSELPLRIAALDSLGRTIPETEIDQLADFVLSTTVEERASAVSALTSACRRVTQPEKIVSLLSSRFSDSTLDLQIVRFDLLKTIGGDAALKQVIQSAMDPSESIQDAATRALGEWLTPDVGPELLIVSQSLRAPKYKIRTLRAYIRVFRQFGLPNDQRLQMARDAFAASTRLEEKVLVLHALLSFQNPDSMQFALEHLKDPGLQATSAQVAIYIADQVGDKQAVIAAMHTILDSGAEATYAKQARDILLKLGDPNP